MGMITLKQQLIYKNGLQLSYSEFGDENGYPLLVQHGLIASIDDYALFDRLIQQKARLICIARPGYGESSPYLLVNYTEWAEIVSLLIQEMRYLNLISWEFHLERLIVMPSVLSSRNKLAAYLY